MSYEPKAGDRVVRIHVLVRGVEVEAVRRPAVVTKITDVGGYRPRTQMLATYDGPKVPGKMADGVFSPDAFECENCSDQSGFVWCRPERADHFEDLLRRRIADGLISAARLALDSAAALFPRDAFNERINATTAINALRDELTGVPRHSRGQG